MTPEQIEAAARKLCEMRGIEPSDLVMSTLRMSIKAAWQVQEAIRQAMILK